MGCEESVPRCWPSLRNGKFGRTWTDKAGSYMGRDELWLERVDYLRDTAGAVRYAIVRVAGISIGGSSSPFGGVLVIELDDEGYPVVRQQIEYNTRNADPDETWAWFSPTNKRLVISATHGWEHCCPTERIIVTFDWNGQRFNVVGRRVKPLRRH
jgi:hypothetical protein